MINFHQMYHEAGLDPMDTTDASTFRSLLRLPQTGKPVITGNKEDIQRLSGTLHYLYARILSTNSNIRNQQRDAAKLMDFLVKFYKLEKEMKPPAK